MTEKERLQLTRIFQRTLVLPLTDSIADQAISLRQRRRMSLGDAIIAATAIAHGQALVTHNTEDFNWIEGLELLDPLTI